MPLALGMPISKSAMCIEPPLPLQVAGLSPVELGHHAVQVGALRDAMTVAAMDALSIPARARRCRGIPRLRSMCSMMKLQGNNSRVRDMLVRIFWPESELRGR